MLELVLSGIAVAGVAATVLLAKGRVAARERIRRLEAESEGFRRRLAPILDVEAEAARVRQALDVERVAAEDAAAASRSRMAEETLKAQQTIDRAREDLARTAADARARQEELAANYVVARETFDRLQREVSLLEENLENISFGVYRPHYEFTTSEEYRARLDEIWEEQKSLIKAERAIQYGVAWTIGDSRKEGERMQKQYGKLLLRAFNGECDASIAKVSWNNVTRMEERIRKGFDSINQLGGVMKISITPEYRELRLQELRLHYELEEKKRAEQEEQRRLREQMRDEERAQRELERAREEAEEDEHRHARALEKAHKEMAKAKDAEAQLALAERIRELEAELDAAHREKERAISRAQMTRSGHVYIISNIGSFGEEVVKIGMTRRLEPRDRIKELSDASVPFDFDIHGIVYCDDAPALEAELHRRFADHRINLVNHRREFFRVRLGDIDEFLRAKQLKLDVTLLAEAREYRETMALRQKLAEVAEPATAVPVVAASSVFPASLFGNGGAQGSEPPTQRS